MEINDVQDPIITVRISQYPEDKKNEKGFKKKWRNIIPTLQKIMTDGT